MLWVLLLLPLLLLLRPGNTASQDSSNPQTMNGILGESVTLSPKLPVGEDIQSITWIHRGRSLIIIMPKVEQFLVTDPKWKHRLQSLGNYSLRLSNLTMEDAGLYCAQITIPTSSELSCYTLKIFRRLSVLNITVHPGLSKTGTCEVHLACSVENSHDALLKWHGAGNTSIYEANLTISWDPRNPSEQKYTCVAENIVSSTSSSVSIQSLCKGNSLSQVPLGALSSCGVWRVLPAQGFLNQKNQHLDTIWIIVVAILMFTVILVGLFVWRKKGIFHFSTQQTQSAAATIRNLDYVSFSPGNTMYACVTHPNRQTNTPTPGQSGGLSTIYSTVHQSKESKTIHSGKAPLDNII
ncbi:SLAM family member 6 isoform X2 [Canis lupus baileyi]|uniref:SLAM family member 6 isoform X2 n=1 Tax=Canis lupus familiaris TaxID=9615 RepID=UPI0003AE6099|nr:SLAM family member 6 isoform X2 [Canis lupus familiaris]XP_035567166.1 SLAM family member 6 isoform X2 [Canis lupus dingo]XP_038304595.1 SLAM family member 6 isoform X2 [Canis lupus familiaris]XP_038442261.1 SLAM family member 6 isoform X2 [Canis lupus familiaris]|eukprot:XP_005640947.1 SLAM family member 6 isoform X6 [Canis lupus familiaris]